MNINETIQLIPICGLPEVQPGYDLGVLIAQAATAAEIQLANHDVIVIAQKIVSKSEGRLVDLATIIPSRKAIEIAERQSRDARLVEVILSESSQLVRQDKHALITETKHGFVCANAGVDKSNVSGKDWVVLLPIDPDASARRLRDRLRELLGVDVAVVITDTFGRAWREGLTNVAIGVAGMNPLRDFRGKLDDHGKELSATVLAVADEIAAASGLLMRKTARLPVVIARNCDYEPGEGSAAMLIRPKERDLFR